MLSHSHSTLVTLGALDALPAPARRGPHHQPVPHGTLVRAMQTEATAHGYEVRRADLAIARRGQRLFGVLDLAVLGETREDRGLAIGFRNSTDATLAITVVAGTRVFVCDNLALSGDLIALQKRNTTHLDLPAALRTGFTRFLEDAQLLNRRIRELEEEPLTDTAAKATVCDLCVERVLPIGLFRRVLRNYFHPTEDMTDCTPRTRWGLHNACTRALSLLAAPRAFTVNVGLGRAFGLTH